MCLLFGWDIIDILIKTSDVVCAMYFSFTYIINIKYSSPLNLASLIPGGFMGARSIGLLKKRSPTEDDDNNNNVIIYCKRTFFMHESSIIHFFFRFVFFTIIFSWLVKKKDKK